MYYTIFEYNVNIIYLNDFVTRPKLHAFCGRTVLRFKRAGKEGFANLYMFSLCMPLI